MADEFFYKFNPDAPEVGPIDSKTLKQLAGSGAIQPESLLRRGTGDWVTASTVKGLFASASPASPPEAVPVTPAEAKPAGPAPIAAPVTASPAASPPEAIPVAPPAAEATGGMSFPDLAQPKPAADVPSGLDSLVVAPKKPGGKPAKKGSPPPAKKSAAAPKVDTPKVEVPNVVAPKAEAPKVEAPKIDVPKAEPVAAPVAAAPVAAAPAAVKPASEAPNAFATDPPAGRVKSRHKGTGGLGSLFNFDVMIAPTVIKALFFVVSGLLLLGYLLIVGGLMVTAVMTGEMVAIATAAGAALSGLVGVLVYIVIFRIMAEVAIVFFNINDNVRDIHDMMVDQQGTIE